MFSIVKKKVHNFRTGLNQSAVAYKHQLKCTMVLWIGCELRPPLRGGLGRAVCSPPELLVCFHTTPAQIKCPYQELLALVQTEQCRFGYTLRYMYIYLNKDWIITILFSFKQGYFSSIRMRAVSRFSLLPKSLSSCYKRQTTMKLSTATTDLSAVII